MMRTVVISSLTEETFFSAIFVRYCFPQSRASRLKKVKENKTYDQYGSAYTIFETIINERRRFLFERNPDRIDEFIIVNKCKYFPYYQLIYSEQRIEKKRE